MLRKAARACTFLILGMFIGWCATQASIHCQSNTHTCVD